MKVSDFSILVCATIYVSAIALSSSVSVFGLCALISFFEVVLLRKTNILVLCKNLFFISLPCLSVFINTFFWGKNTGQHISVAGVNVYFSSLHNGYYLFMRSFSIAAVSVSFFSSINFTRLINHFMQMGMNPRIALSITAAANSFPFLMQEFSRIRVACAMKNRKGLLAPIIPLFASAVRYSHTLTLSMNARGLGEKRTLLERFSFCWKDYFFVFFNMAAVTAVFICCR